VNGTHVLLQEACSFWNGTYKGRFLQVSTDEVFGSIEEGGRFTEQSAYRPNSPYSATKAAADLLARSYFRTYGLDVAITNCSTSWYLRPNHTQSR
jgi:dTDP-glucose 4,6-dehydratase